MVLNIEGRFSEKSPEEIDQEKKVHKEKVKLLIDLANKSFGGHYLSDISAYIGRLNDEDLDVYQEKLSELSVKKDKMYKEMYDEQSKVGDEIKALASKKEIRE